ncbi:hypothetical protein PSTG_08370 [Puccinia striiformis f. sp. tritici PST-78]|uniref:Uncharacterized protein n=1 Tax=Puccinia striiformis f. sp. tritici PST-78 TaxID=1165861 RepID=A0A0L0VGB5_9BASI|nr:hypothetical protein PSTG_08370 [Puccinia striiformis f. sp. tritici PST-78]
MGSHCTPGIRHGAVATSGRTQPGWWTATRKITLLMKFGAPSQRRSGDSMPINRSAKWCPRLGFSSGYLANPFGNADIGAKPSDSLVTLSAGARVLVVPPPSAYFAPCDADVGTVQLGGAENEQCLNKAQGISRPIVIGLGAHATGITLGPLSLDI